MHPNTSWLCTAATATSALKQWRSVASYKPLPITMLGFSSWPEFDGAVEELRDTIERQQPLSELDWTRVLVLTEIALASNVLGAGLDFELVSSVSDTDAVELLRSIQRKLASKLTLTCFSPTRAARAGRSTTTPGRRKTAHPVNG